VLAPALCDELLPSDRSEAAGTLPNILVIGAQRSGTTWLSHLLGRFPAIYLPQFKEPQFFSNFHASRIELSDSPGATPAALRYLEAPIRRLKRYRQLFSSSHAFNVDASPELALLPPASICHVADLLGRDTRVIFLTRDPVERAWSHLRFDMLLGGHEFRSISYHCRLLHYVSSISRRRADYARTLRQWSAEFPRMLHLSLEEIDADGEEVAARVAHFIGEPLPPSAGKIPAQNRGPSYPFPPEDLTFLRRLYAT
jgi:hypothetical protein